MFTKEKKKRQLFFLESGERTSITLASDPAMAAATELGVSKVWGAAIKHKSTECRKKLDILLLVEL